jgi:hypothetical protein
MPTFFNPGGRTLAGGDTGPCVIPCPKADGLRKLAANTVTAIIRVIFRAFVLRTAIFLFII